MDSGARSGRMYFRKTYVIEGKVSRRTGQVLQELRWMKEMDGWKIVSERDLRVIRPPRRQWSEEQLQSSDALATCLDGM
jgi:hypothetical protein